MATPPIIAVEFLCQRSVFGLATNPQRRANIRTNGVNKSASANETAGGIRLDKLRGNIVCKLRGKAIRLKRQRQVRKIDGHAVASSTPGLDVSATLGSRMKDNYQPRKRQRHLLDES